MEVSGLRFASLARWGPAQDSIPPCLCATPSPSGAAHEHVSQSPCSLWPPMGISTFHTSRCPSGLQRPSLHPSLVLCPWVGPDVECLGPSARSSCLQFSLHDFICSKYVEKKRNEKHSTNQSICFGQKMNTNRGCILNVRLGIMLLPLCAFGLCVAVFCQHEILSPLEDFRGGRATSLGFQGNLWFP